MIVIRIDSLSSLPSIWQTGWEVTRGPAIEGIRRDTIARAPLGTPLPAGARDAVELPEVTGAELRAAREHLERIAAGRDELRATIARDDLEHLERYVQIARGVPHPLAYHAAWSVSTLDQAVRSWCRARDLWASPCSSAVVRAALPDGYQVWRGIGGRLDGAGRAPTYERAEELAIEAVAAERGRVMARVHEILEGWSPATPYYTSTIARAAEELSLQISRGPVTAAEAGSSWDLPIVAEVRDRQIVRHPERVTWNDADSRAAALERKRAGEARRSAEVREALAHLAEHPTLAPLCRPRGLAIAEVALGAGRSVRTLGPVRMRPDGAVALALVEDVGRWPRRYWMALGHFAALDTELAGA